MLPETPGREDHRMGRTVPNKCALCGSDAPGRRWRVKGSKYICKECHDRLNVEIGYVKWSNMNFTEIKNYLSDKDRLSTQKTCSFCGQKLSGNDLFRKLLKDKSVLCGKCAESMRIVRPVFLTVKSDGGYGYETAADDPMKELTLEDVPWVQKEAAEERERRVAKYGNHKAVFVVDDVTKYKKEEDTHEIYGRVMLGRIDKGDTLRVKRREGEYRKVVDKINPPEYLKKSPYLPEGHEGNLMVSGDVSFIYPGDVLVVERV